MRTYRDGMRVLGVIDELRVLVDLGLQQLVQAGGLRLDGVVHPEDGRNGVDLEQAVDLLVYRGDAVLRIHAEAQDVAARLGEGLQHQCAPEL